MAATNDLAHARWPKAVESNGESRPAVPCSGLVLGGLGSVFILSFHYFHSEQRPMAQNRLCRDDLSEHHNDSSRREMSGCGLPHCKLRPLNRRLECATRMESH